MSTLTSHCMDGDGLEGPSRRAVRGAEENDAETGRSRNKGKSHKKANSVSTAKHSEPWEFPRTSTKTKMRRSKKEPEVALVLSTPDFKAITNTLCGDPVKTKKPKPKKTKKIQEPSRRPRAPSSSSSEDSNDIGDFVPRPAPAEPKKDAKPKKENKKKNKPPPAPIKPPKPTKNLKWDEQKASSHGKTPSSRPAHSDAPPPSEKPASQLGWDTEPITVRDDTEALAGDHGTHKIPSLGDWGAEVQPNGSNKSASRAGSGAEHHSQGSKKSSAGGWGAGSEQVSRHGGISGSMEGSVRGWDDETQPEGSKRGSVGGWGGDNPAQGSHKVSTRASKSISPPLTATPSESPAEQELLKKMLKARGKKHGKAKRTPDEEEAGRMRAEEKDAEAKTLAMELEGLKSPPFSAKFDVWEMDPTSKPPSTVGSGAEHERRTSSHGSHHDSPERSRKQRTDGHRSSSRKSHRSSHNSKDVDVLDDGHRSSSHKSHRSNRHSNEAPDAIAGSQRASQKSKSHHRGGSKPPLDAIPEDEPAPDFARDFAAEMPGGWDEPAKTSSRKSTANSASHRSGPDLKDGWNTNAPAVSSYHAPTVEEADDSTPKKSSHHGSPTHAGAERSASHSSRRTRSTEKVDSWFGDLPKPAALSSRSGSRRSGSQGSNPSMEEEKDASIGTGYGGREDSGAGRARSGSGSGATKSGTASKSTSHGSTKADLWVKDGFLGERDSKVSGRSGSQGQAMAGAVGEW